MAILGVSSKSNVVLYALGRIVSFEEGVRDVTLGNSFLSRVRFFEEGLAFNVRVLGDPDFWKTFFVSFEKLREGPVYLRSTPYLFSVFKREFLKDGIFSLPLDYYGKRIVLHLRPFAGKIVFRQMLDLWLPYLVEEKRMLFGRGTPQDVVHSPFEALYLSPRRRVFWGSEGPYENEKTCPREGDWVLDVGAYVGVFTVLSGKAVGEKGKVFAFEPQERSRKVLEANLRLNRLSNVVVVPKALGDRESKVTMRGMVIKRWGRGYIECTTLDAWAKASHLERLDFLKMDVEGFERKVLCGGMETLCQFKPRMGICIYHLPDDPEVLRELVLKVNPCYHIAFNVTGKKYTVWRD